jgi:hypothetical protein
MNLLENLIKEILLSELGDIRALPTKFYGLYAFVNAYNDVKNLLPPDAPTVWLDYDPKYRENFIRYNKTGRATIGPNVEPNVMFNGPGHDIVHILTVNLAKRFTAKKANKKFYPKSLVKKAIEMVNQKYDIDLMSILKLANFDYFELVKKLKDSDLPEEIKNDSLLKLQTKDYFAKPLVPGKHVQQKSGNSIDTDGDLPQHMAEEIFGNAIRRGWEHEVINSQPLESVEYVMSNIRSQLSDQSSSKYRSELRPFLKQFSQKFTGTDDYVDGFSSNDSILSQFRNRYNIHLSKIQKVKSYEK